MMKLRKVFPIFLFFFHIQAFGLEPWKGEFLTVCNTGDVRLLVAIVTDAGHQSGSLFFPKSDWETSGWYAIEPNKCKHIAHGNYSDGAFFLGFNIDGNPVKYNLTPNPDPFAPPPISKNVEREFCVNLNEPYTFVADEKADLSYLSKCPTGYQLWPFSLFTVLGNGDQKEISIPAKKTFPSAKKASQTSSNDIENMKYDYVCLRNTTSHNIPYKITTGETFGSAISHLSSEGDTIVIYGSAVEGSIIFDEDVFKEGFQGKEYRVEFYTANSKYALGEKRLCDKLNGYMFRMIEGKVDLFKMPHKKTPSQKVEEFVENLRKSSDSIKKKKLIGAWQCTLTETDVTANTNVTLNVNGLDNYEPNGQGSSTYIVTFKANILGEALEFKYFVDLTWTWDVSDGNLVAKLKSVKSIATTDSELSETLNPKHFFRKGKTYTDEILKISKTVLTTKSKDGTVSSCTRK